MIICPKCGEQGKYYYDGVYIRCNSCGFIEWAKKESDGHITDLWGKWERKEEVKYVA